MSTPYSKIINVFLNKITDYDLPNFEENLRDNIVIGYMKSACVRFKYNCKIDLSDRDETLQVFNNDLDDEIIEIIAENMLIEWLKPKLLNTDNFKNALSTKDFSLFSPANLLDKTNDTMELITKNARKLINNYSFNHANPEDLLKK